jgi:hypothetical protein
MYESARRLEEAERRLERFGIEVYGHPDHPALYRVNGKTATFQDLMDIAGMDEKP